jgi:hypothetical protein
MKAKVVLSKIGTVFSTVMAALAIGLAMVVLAGLALAGMFKSSLDDPENADRPAGDSPR